MNAPARRRAESNGLGLAGFIVSLIGLCMGGLLSPVGLILSLIALKDQPRGFAIAGVVLGCLGLCGTVISLLFFLPFVFALLVAVGATGLALALGGDELIVRAEMTDLTDRIALHQQANGGALPLLLTDMSPSPDQDLLTDPWGQAYVYVASPDGTFTMRSMGEDRVDGTADDVVYDPDIRINIPPSMRGRSNRQP